MRIETTRSAAAVRLRHAVGVHTSPADLLEQLVTLATGGLELAAPVALALRPATEEALRAALGDPVGLVALAQPDGPDEGSGQTVAAQRARELRGLGRTAGPVTVLAEHTSRLDGPDGAFWTELDAAVNVALADLPVTMTCFYPELPLHAQVLEGAWLNHPLAYAGGRFRPNPAHRPPHEVLADRPPPAPPLLGPPDVRLGFRAWQLHDVRRAVDDQLVAAGYGRTRREDVVLAVNELATNALEHGTLEAELCLWAEPGGLVCEVHDGGTLTDPLPGLQAPHPSDARGRGLWIARQLCDLLHVWSDEAGTHVRMRAAP